MSRPCTTDETVRALGSVGQDIADQLSRIADAQDRIARAQRQRNAIELLKHCDHMPDDEHQELVEAAVDGLV